MPSLSEKRSCRNCATEFIIEPDDFGFYEKVGVPAPMLCPNCRLRRRLLFRNERTFYRRKCDLCKRDIIATYPADAPFPVYCVKCWWSDTWDPLAYGQDFNFSKPFFEQFNELFRKVPMISIMNDDGIASINCEYSYDWAFSKNCYMAVCGWHVENCLYSYHINHGKDIMDCFNVHDSELMYESFNSHKCYGCSYCIHCYDSRNCIVGYDLRNCSDCTLSVGLRNQRFCILNKQFSEEDYKKELQRMKVGSRKFFEENWKRFEELISRHPHKYALITKSVDTTGDILRNCKNSHYCFYHNDLENCKFMVVGDSAKDSYDCNHTGKPDLCYNCATPDQSYGSISTIFSWRCTQVQYSNNCHGSEYLFGCSGIKNSSYAIFNKKYSKEEYTDIYQKIRSHMKKTGEWGEFFPENTSPFAYNETAAHEWFPITRDEALKQSLGWKESEEKKYQPTVSIGQLPDLITETTDDIVSQIIECEHKGACDEKCTSAFRVVPQELQLYRRLNVPIPKLCPNCRHYKRLAIKNPVSLWQRLCDCSGKISKNSVYKNTIEHFHKDSACPNEFETSYAQDRPEIVYCEQCYNAEIA